MKKEEKNLAAAAAAKAVAKQAAGQQSAAELQAMSGQMPAKEGTSGQMWTEEAARKKIARMNLLDDFLFGTVVAYPEIGEMFVRVLLKTIFGREYKYLSVTAQKVLYGADTDLHGARLDVFTEPEEREPGKGLWSMT